MRGWWGVVAWAIGGAAIARAAPPSRVAPDASDELRAAVVGPDVVELADELDAFDEVVLVGGAGYRCSGVLIGPRHVLTAGHCLPATRVGFGHAMDGATAIAVETTTRHPSADVAVLRLVAPVAIPVRARRRDPRAAPPLGVVRAIGFGVSDPRALTGFGRKRRIDVAIDGWGCTPGRAGELGCVPERELLLRGGRGNDTCLGDSGGPLYEQTSAGWRLVGITSRGTRPRKLLCGEGGVYARVDVLDAWIEEVTR
ncbi:MAG: S1 family peptidase [Kofleriaceae bacterium]